MRSDSDLLDAWAAGDRAAGREFYRRYADRVTRFFTRKIEGDVPDLVQRTFLKCLEARRAGAEVGNAAAMLFAIARNELYDAFTRLRRAREQWSPDEVTLEDLGTRPSVELAQLEQQRLLLAALRRIPLDAQLAIELYYWEELSMEDVARVLGVTRSAAINRIHRARELLRSKLEEAEASPQLVSDTLSGFETWARSLRPPAPDPSDG